MKKSLGLFFKCISGPYCEWFICASFCLKCFGLEKFNENVITVFCCEMTDFSLVTYGFLHSTASWHSYLPQSNQKPMNWIVLILHFFFSFFNEPFHSDVCHNTEEKIFRYCCFIVILKVQCIVFYFSSLTVKIMIVSK